MTNNLIEVPSFNVALTQLVALVEEHPDNITPLRYYDKDEQPYCLLGHALETQGAELDPNAYFKWASPRNQIRISVLWRDVYAPASERPFPMRDSAKAAEDYLVGALYDRVQSWQDRGIAWQPALIGALKSFIKWAQSPTSGFLVQSDGAYPEVLRDALDLSALALNTLTRN